MKPQAQSETRGQGKFRERWIQSFISKQRHSPNLPGSLPYFPPQVLHARRSIRLLLSHDLLSPPLSPPPSACPSSITATSCMALIVFPPLQNEQELKGCRRMSTGGQMEPGSFRPEPLTWGLWMASGGTEVPVCDCAPMHLPGGLESSSGSVL